MQLRKELVLFLAVLALALLLIATSGEAPGVKRLTPPAPKPIETPSFPNSAALGRDPAALARGTRDLFLKPSATKPLPPLELELPALAPLPGLLPLVEPGPVLSKAYLQRVVFQALPGKSPDTAVRTGGGTEPQEGGAPDGPLDPGPVPTDPQDVATADYGDEYDRITLVNGDKIWGQARGEDPHSYGRPEESNVWAVIGPFQQQVVFQTYRPEKGTPGIINPFPPDRVQRIEFARRVDNKIALMRRRIPEDDTGLELRRNFAIDLLENYRDDDGALQEAARQATRHIELAPTDPRGYELKAFVLHSTAQYEAELEFYAGLANTPFRDAPFVHVGRGMVARKLGMDALAEREFGRATEIDQGYPRAWLQLAKLALDRGDSATALAHARRAVANRVPGGTERVAHEADLVLVRALIADAQFPEASTRLLDLESRIGAPEPALLAELRRLRGAAQLGLGQFAEARASYEEAAALAPSDAMASLGAAVAALRLGDRDAALANAEAAAQRDPLLRARALAAQALLHELGDRRPEALARLTEAREMAPEGTYVLYLLGRTLRLASENGEARLVLQKLLEERSDFLEAMAERALATMEHARNEARNDPAGALVLLGEAERFAARVCRDEAERAKNPLYLDLLGTIRYYKLDNEGAKDAFRRSLEWQPGPYAKILLALIQYRQGYTADALANLQALPLQIRDPQDRFRLFAEAAYDAISDHRGKRLFTDDFDRDLGEVWQTESRHQAKWAAVDGKLRLRGRSDGDQRIAHARYTLDEARNFLEVTCQITLLPGNTGRQALLRMTEVESVARTNREPSVRLEVGFDRLKGGAFVYYHQNNNQGDQNRSELQQGDPGFPSGIEIRPGEPFTVQVQRLGATQARGPGAAQKEILVVRIDGREVLRREITESFGLRQRPVAIDLHVSGPEGAQLDTAFDDFRLIRYGEG